MTIIGAGGDGGKGIVVIRYSSGTATGGTITSYGSVGYTIN